MEYRIEDETRVVMDVRILIADDDADGQILLQSPMFALLVSVGGLRAALVDNEATVDVYNAVREHREFDIPAARETAELAMFDRYQITRFRPIVTYANDSFELRAKSFAIEGDNVGYWLQMRLSENSERALRELEASALRNSIGDARIAISIDDLLVGTITISGSRQDDLLTVVESEKNILAVLGAIAVAGPLSQNYQVVGFEEIGQKGGETK